MLEEGLVDLQVTVARVGLYGAVVENGHGHLGIRGLRAELEVRVSQALAYCVHANQGAGREEVLALQAALAHRVLLRPHGVGVLGEKLGGRQLIARVASRRALRAVKLGGSGHVIHVGEALLRVSTGIHIGKRLGVSTHIGETICTIQRNIEVFSEFLKLRFSRSILISRGTGIGIRPQCGRIGKTRLH